MFCKAQPTFLSSYGPLPKRDVCSLPCLVHLTLNSHFALVSVPFQRIDGTASDKFRSPIVLSTCQSALSSLSAFAYLYIRRKPGQTFSQILGLEPTPAIRRASISNGSALAGKKAYTNGHTNGHATHHKSDKSDTRFSTKSLLLRYFQCSCLITSATPFGFAALSYITYPAMVLGKSCKLIPVMIMNVVLYRRRFAPHKYLVVGMVTLGITLFFGFGKEKPSKSSSKNGDLPLYTQLIGIAFLLINLAIDGATNSTQDEIFARFRVTGQQMMFWISIFNTLLTTTISILPLPYIPVLHPSGSGTEFQVAKEFIQMHPTVVKPMMQFAFTGSLGQLFIFETLQHFGSLTLVYVPKPRILMGPLIYHTLLGRSH